MGFQELSSLIEDPSLLIEYGKEFALSQGFNDCSLLPSTQKQIDPLNIQMQ